LRNQKWGLKEPFFEGYLYRFFEELFKDMFFKEPWFERFFVEPETVS